MMTRMRATLISSLTLAIAIITSCVQYERVPLRGLPDREQFIAEENGVSFFLEKRCGALDCHGQVGRPMRIYSKEGLRLADGPNGARDTSDTTRAERLANYDTVIGLEPDAIADCYRTRGKYQDFQLLLKPLDESGRGVKHKGGPVLARTDGDAGWACLHGWLSGTLDAPRCKEAAY
jgi:hypothetical protein